MRKESVKEEVIIGRKGKYVEMLKHLAPRLIFFIDAMGASISTVVLALVLPYFKNLVGLPKTALYTLASIAITFAIYSFLCFVLSPQNWRPWLKTIAIANLIYCLFTLLLVVYYYSTISILGICYFALETMAIVLLASFELRTAHSFNKT